MTDSVFLSNLITMDAALKDADLRKKLFNNASLRTKAEESLQDGDLCFVGEVLSHLPSFVICSYGFYDSSSFQTRRWFEIDANSLHELANAVKTINEFYFAVPSLDAKTKEVLEKENFTCEEMDSYCNEVYNELKKWVDVMMKPEYSEEQIDEELEVVLTDGWMSHLLVDKTNGIAYDFKAV